MRVISFNQFDISCTNLLYGLAVLSFSIDLCASCTDSFRQHAVEINLVGRTCKLARTLSYKTQVVADHSAVKQLALLTACLGCLVWALKFYLFLDAV
jgi:hypothetical protein